MVKKIETFSFLGWVLQITYADEIESSVFQVDFTNKNCLAMLTNNKKSIFLTTMKEKPKTKPSKPRNEKEVSKIYQMWSQKTCDKEWIATVQKIPAINKSIRPISIKYWSDKYSNNSDGAIYFHEFGNPEKYDMGISKGKNTKPIAIFIDRCRITQRGIE